MRAAGLGIEVDSAGTSAFHQGEEPDSRSISAGSKAGYSFSGIYARQITQDDFSDYDLILAMDQSNLSELQRRSPSQYQDKLKLFMAYHPEFPSQKDVPDPYYEGKEGFERVLQLIEEGCDNLLQHLH